MVARHIPRPRSRRAIAVRRHLGEHALRDGERDAARRLQALRLRQGPVGVRPRGLHRGASRDGEALGVRGARARAAARGGLAAALAALALAGCGRAGSQAPGAEAPELHIYNWADYIGKDTIADFEARTGIKVVYD